MLRTNGGHPELELQVRTVKQAAHQFRQALAPGLLALGVPDQVLADFDDAVGQVPHGSMLPHGIALEAARVGGIVADDQVVFGVEGLEQWLGEARVAVPKTPACQGRTAPFQTGVNEWIDSRMGVVPACMAASRRSNMAE